MWRYIFRRLLFSIARRARTTLGCSALVVTGDGSTAPSRLMIVAHPDDESLFGGEALTSSSGWLVVCVTGASNDLRRHEFIGAMTSIGASYMMLDHDDDLRNGNFSPRLEEQLSAVIAGRPYQAVVTHNAAGEYGHPQHRALHRVVRRLIADRPLHVFAHRWTHPAMSPAKRALLAHYRSQAVSIAHRGFLVWREELRRVQ